MLLVEHFPLGTSLAHGFAVGGYLFTSFFVGLILYFQLVRHHPRDFQPDIVQVDLLIHIVPIIEIADNEAADVIDLVSAELHGCAIA